MTLFFKFSMLCESGLARCCKRNDKTIYELLEFQEIVVNTICL